MPGPRRGRCATHLQAKESNFQLHQESKSGKVPGRASSLAADREALDIFSFKSDLLFVFGVLLLGHTQGYFWLVVQITPGSRELGVGRGEAREKWGDTGSAGREPRDPACKTY